MKRGKKTRRWEKVRAEIKEQFIKWGINRCELGWAGCWGQIQGFAHSKKRRHIEGDEIYEVIGVCNSCHDKLEYRNDMTEIVRAIIAGRFDFESNSDYY